MALATDLVIAEIFTMQSGNPPHLALAKSGKVNMPYCTYGFLASEVSINDFKGNLMKTYHIALRVLVAHIAAVAALGAPGSALALGQRTFVSVDGLDTNTATNCAKTTPCRTFNAAIGVTITGGEIVAADSGGFGPITINKAITITGAPGVYAAISPTSGNGITISTGSANDKVVINNLHIDGVSAGAGAGISLSNGNLILLNTEITRYAYGLLVTTGAADLNNVKLTANTVAVRAVGQGPDQDLSCNNTPRVSVVRISRSIIVDNDTAFQMHNPGTNVGGGTPTACNTGANPGGARAPGSSNAQNIFLSNEANTSIPNSLISGNTRFVDVTGLAEYNGVSSPDGTIGYFYSQSQNSSSVANQ